MCKSLGFMRSLGDPPGTSLLVTAGPSWSMCRWWDQEMSRLDFGMELKHEGAPGFGLLRRCSCSHVLQSITDIYMFCLHLVIQNEFEHVSKDLQR